jgi:hypothetical protein
MEFLVTGDEEGRLGIEFVAHSRFLVHLISNDARQLCANSTMPSRKMTAVASVFAIYFNELWFPDGHQEKQAQV